MANIPDKPSLDGIEARWTQRWEDEGTYRFDRTATRDQVFAIDTPPPTVSGSLHVGHVFSYTHTDTSERRVGVVPDNVKGSINYRYKRFNIGLSGIWRSNAPWNNATRYLRENLKCDLTAGFRLTNRLTLNVQGRNIFEEPHRIYEFVGGNKPVLWRYENYGSNWTFTLKGSF